jgi:hypothetical protein
MPNSQPTECINNVPQFCNEDGQFEPAGGACSGDTPVCLDGRCVECQPNGNPTECRDANTPQYCNAQGQWQDHTDCTGSDPFCLDGDCVECEEDSIDCRDMNTPRTCSADGEWEDETDCTGPTPVCLGGNCVACQPTTKSCVDLNTPQTCSGAGQWVPGTDCSGQTPVCLAGNCVACTPNPTPTACLDSNTPQYCNASGQWASAADCTGGTPACLNGSCVQCAPNPTPTHCPSSCTKTRQYCSPTGTWTDFSPACSGANLCSNGSCVLGPEETLGNPTQFSSCSSGYQNNMLANRIEITCRSTLLRLGTKFSTAAGSVRFAVYTDVAGAPGAALGGTGSVSAATGEAALVSNVTLTPGFYWIAMNFDSASACPSENAQAPADSLRYGPFNFSNSAFPPSTFPTGGASLPTLFNLYAVIRRNP